MSYIFTQASSWGRERKYDYVFGTVIGEGAFGYVCDCYRRSTKEKFACKVISKADAAARGALDDVVREARLLRALSGKHPGIVRLVESFEDHASIYLVMEKCDAGDLFELINGQHKKGLPEEHARELFRELASAVAFCHSQDILHRDIKPENILLTAVPPMPQRRQDFAASTPATSEGSSPVSPTISGSSSASSLSTLQDDSARAAARGQWAGKVKLADFGLALHIPSGVAGEGLAGSRFYTAPEMVQGRSYGRRADVWSLGVVLCAMLTGRLPFCGKNKEDVAGVRRAILAGKVNFGSASWQGVSAEAVDLVRRMLVLEPRGRLRASDVLEHPWLADSLPAAASPPPSPTGTASSLSTFTFSLSPQASPQRHTPSLSSVSIDEGESSIHCHHHHHHEHQHKPQQGQQAQQLPPAAPMVGLSSPPSPSSRSTASASEGAPHCTAAAGGSEGEPSSAAAADAGGPGEGEGEQCGGDDRRIGRLPVVSLSRWLSKRWAAGFTVRPARVEPQESSADEAAATAAWEMNAEKNEMRTSGDAGAAAAAATIDSVSSCRQSCLLSPPVTCGSPSRHAQADLSREQGQEQGQEQEQAHRPRRLPPPNCFDCSGMICC